jgi:hypothetical protein
MPRRPQVQLQSARGLKREKQDNVIESVLLLLAPHSKPQNNLINAWELRYWVNDPQFDPADPLKTSVSEEEWDMRRSNDPSLPPFTVLTITFPDLRFVVGACGTKFGKTYGCSIRIVKEAWNNPNTLNWWVAPTYAQAENAYAAVKSLLPEGYYKEQYSKMRLTLLHPDGSARSVIEFKSGDDPASLRGFAVHFFIMDEAAQGMPEASFISIMTTTTETQGRGIIISTPNGKGWFYVVYQRGVKYYPDGTPRYVGDDKDPFPEWFSVRMPTHANPHIKIEEVELKRRQMPVAIFQQEYLAMFLNDESNVFRGVAGCERGSLEKPQQGRHYVLAADLAKHKDYTVIIVMDRITRHVVYIERFNKISWPFQKSRIIQIAQDYNRAYIIVDATGVGDAIYDDLVESGLKVEPYKLHSNEPKRILIEKLILSIEQARISWPRADAECVFSDRMTKRQALLQLRKELESYEFKKTPNGATKYEAPSGQHDDCVVALALANFVVAQEPFIYKHKKIRGI